MYVFIFIPPPQKKKNVIVPFILNDHVCFSIAIDSEMIPISSILQPREIIYLNPMWCE